MNTYLDLLHVRPLLVLPQNEPDGVPRPLQVRHVGVGEHLPAQPLPGFLGLLLPGGVEAEVAARLALDDVVQVGVGLTAGQGNRRVKKRLNE